MDRRGTIVYVHGASDRGAQVDDQVARIERQLDLSAMPFDVLPARWGELAGARLERIDDVLPAPQPVSAAALQELLTRGPLAELEQLALASAASQRAGWRDADQLLEICRTEVGAPSELVPLGGGRTEGMAAACRAAAAEVAASDAYKGARQAAVPETELVAAAGRAVAATVASDTTQPLDVLSSVQVRIAEVVLGAAAATLLAGYLGIDVGAGLKRWATDVLLPHRARIMRDAGLGSADVLLYQRDGARIRQVVARELAAARARGGPVVALGNSLGGIVLVGLLAEPDAPKPDLLVTVGSQAPLLAIIGALGPSDGETPSVFEPWLNIYDRRDLLGFTAQRVWPGQPGIADREVDMGLGFPDSHGASYLSHPEVYRHIREHRVLADGTPGGPAPSARNFPIRLGDRSLLLLRLLFGVREDNAFVELDGELDAHFGYFRLRTPIANVKSWRIEGPWSWLTAIGLRRGLFAGDVTFGGNHIGGVRLNFHQPVRWLVFRVPALYVTVEDLEGFAAALAARGIGGRDDRRQPAPVDQP